MSSYIIVCVYTDFLGVFARISTYLSLIAFTISKTNALQYGSLVIFMFTYIGCSGKEMTVLPMYQVLGMPQCPYQPMCITTLVCTVQLTIILYVHHKYLSMVVSGMCNVNHTLLAAHRAKVNVNRL